MGSKKNICDSGSESQLVLDSVKGELVKAPARAVKKTTTIDTEAKALAALKNHSEAEKRRRQRINAHLTTLRALVPSSTQKMDKATLLAEVITQMKELEKKASETCKGVLVPMDRDEVTVEPLACDQLDIHNTAGGFKVSLCFKYRHDVMLHLRKAITALQLRVVTMEMSSFEEWLKIAFIFFTDCKSFDDDHDSGNNKDQMKMISIHRAFSSVLEKNSSVDDDYSTANTNTNTTTSVSRKRRRVSVFESSSSSS